MCGSCLHQFDAFIHCSMVRIALPKSPQVRISRNTASSYASYALLEQCRPTRRERMLALAWQARPYNWLLSDRSWTPQ